MRFKDMIARVIFYKEDDNLGWKPELLSVTRRYAQQVWNIEHARRYAKPQSCLKSLIIERSCKLSSALRIAKRAFCKVKIAVCPDQLNKS
jgi:hypothetical protein